MMRYNTILLTIPFLLALSCQDNVQEDIKRLDDTLSRKEVYENYLIDKIHTLKSLITDSKPTDYEHLYSVTLQLAQEYSAYNYDSTIECCHKCMEYAGRLGDGKRYSEAILLLAMENIKAGYYLEAKEILQSVDESVLDDSLLGNYYFTVWRLSNEMMMYAPDEETTNEYKSVNKEYNLRAQSVLEEGSYRWWFLKYSEKNLEGNRDECIDCAKKMLDATSPLTKEYAIAAFFVGYNYSQYDADSLVHYLAESAITDVMLSTKDHASLMHLAEYLFNNQDYDRSFRYMADHCMPDAIFFNGKLRPWQVSQFFPEIERAYEEKLRYRNRQIRMYLILVSLLSLMVIFILFILAKRQKSLSVLNARLKSSNDQMQEANVIKQEYITSFLSMLSENISSTRQYKNHVYRCIRSGSAKELEKEIESLPPIDKDIDQFYHIFDSTFINIFPDFVEEFNELLADGEKIIIKGNEILTPELRIFALIRLGISDSRRIASLLHYSPNTIFNYRSKIRNKARGKREDFEKEVMKIN